MYHYLFAERQNGHYVSCMFSGDAYMARGSYTAALKTFQRATELIPQSIYLAYQIAPIK